MPGTHSSNLDLINFPMNDNWDQLLDDWELGLGGESARQMTTYFEQYRPAENFGGSVG